MFEVQLQLKYHTFQKSDAVPSVATETTVAEEQTNFTATVGVKASISRVLDAVIPTALQNIAEEGSHQHPLDETMFGGSIDRIENNQRLQVCAGSFYFGDTDNFTVPSPDLNFLRQVKLPMKPPTQIGVDHGGNLIRSFLFNMKADSRTELSRLAKSTRRQSLSLAQRVTSSTSGMQIVYKVANSVEEISSVTSTTTSSTVTTNQGNISYPVTQNSDYSDEDDTKSPSAVLDPVCQDACDSLVTTSQGDTLDPTVQNSDYSDEDNTKSPRAVPDSAQGNTPCPTIQNSHKSDDHTKCKSFVADSMSEDKDDNVETTNQGITSEPSNQNSDYSDEDNTKSLSVVPDSVSEDAVDYDSQNSPVFRVQMPHSFSTEYPADSSITFASQGLIEVENLGTSVLQDHYSEELISNPDNVTGSDYVEESVKNVQGEVTVVSKMFPVDNSDDTKTFPEDDSAMEVDKTAVISGPDEYDNKDVSNSDDTKTFPEEDSAMEVDKTAVISGPHQSETKDSTELMVSHKRPLSDPQMCPFKKRFRNKEGKTYQFDNTGDEGPVHISDLSDTSIASESDSAEIISLFKEHFIVQDLGVAEMMAEGESKIFVHVHTSSEYKDLLQRLIVKIGENKGWKAQFEKVPLVEIPNIQHLLHNGETAVVYTDIALDSKSDVPNPDVSISKKINENANHHGSDLSASHEVHIDSHVTERSGLIGGSCRSGEVRIKQNVGVDDVTKTDSNKSMDIKSKSDSETNSATQKEKVNDDGSDQTVTKTECTEKVTDDKSIQEVIKTDVDKSNSDSEYDDEAIDIDETDTEKGSGNGSSSGSSGSSSSGTDDSKKDSESANDDDDDNHSSNEGTQQLMSNKDSDNDDTLNDHMSSQHILPETKGEPERDTAEIQDDIAEPETGFLILERLMREQEQLEFHAAEVGVKVDKHSKNVHYLVTDRQMNTCVCNFRIQNLSVASLQKSV